MTKHNLTTEERMLSKINKTNSCWLWTDKPTATGYGKLGIDGKTSLAHRVAYQLWIGPIPLDKPQVNHHCGIPPCVNPKHLYAGTQEDNMNDRVRAGNHPNKKKTHCPQGHEYNETNTYISRKNGRYCKECGKIRDKIKYINSKIK